MYCIVLGQTSDPPNIRASIATEFASSFGNPSMKHPFYLIRVGYRVSEQHTAGNSEGVEQGTSSHAVQSLHPCVDMLEFF